MAGLIRFFAIQSNLYMVALYKAITLYIMVTKQLPENHALYTVFTVKLTCILRPPVYNGCGLPLDFPNPQIEGLHARSS